MKKIMFNDKYGLTKAVLEGRKTQIRRVINHSRVEIYNDYPYYKCEIDVIHPIEPKYLIGEVVAVAQSYQTIFDKQGTLHNKWLCDIPLNHAGWHNKMFTCAYRMVHHIRITNVRVEKLHDISDKDCMAEGIFKHWDGQCFVYYSDIDDEYIAPQAAFADLIDKVSGKGTWDSNPYVFVYDFELVD